MLNLQAIADAPTNAVSMVASKSTRTKACLYLLRLALGFVCSSHSIMYELLLHMRQNGLNTNTVVKLFLYIVLTEKGCCTCAWICERFPSSAE